MVAPGFAAMAAWTCAKAGLDQFVIGWTIAAIARGASSRRRPI